MLPLLFDAFAFRAFRFVICLMVSVAAFRRGAFPAFSPIKREKHEKQRAFFLMWYRHVPLDTSAGSPSPSTVSPVSSPGGGHRDPRECRSGISNMAMRLFQLFCFSQLILDLFTTGQP